MKSTPKTVWKRTRNAMQAMLLLVLVCVPQSGSAYSVQTHQQLVDLSWEGSIVPLLQTRFPGLTEAQIDEAHAYAYGGSAIQDIGYYPFGNDFFSDLTHYVRSGDFIASLLRNARTADELAFALGALSHYIGDTVGHSTAVNLAVPVEFPKLGAKYGPSVNYEQNPHAHVQTEFAFDIDQISKGRFAPLKYLDHIGLKVSTNLLGRAFFETYGLPLNKVLKVQRTTIGGYSFGVRHFLPRIAFAENVLHGKSFPPDVQDEDFLRLQADLAQVARDNGWEAYRRKPGIGTHLLAGFIYIVPKVGITRMLAIKGPTSDTEQLYVRSVNRSTDAFRLILERMKDRPEATPAGAVPIRQTAIPNRDLDTGLKVAPGNYRLADKTYDRLLGALTRDAALRIPSGLQEDVAAYYANPGAVGTLNTEKKLAHVQDELKVLKGMQAIPEP